MSVRGAAAAIALVLIAAVLLEFAHPPREPQGSVVRSSEAMGLIAPGR